MVMQIALSQMGVPSNLFGVVGYVTIVPSALSETVQVKN